MLATLAAAAIMHIPAKAINYAVMVHGAGGGGWEYHKWRPVFEKAGWTVIDRDLQPAQGGLPRRN